MPSPIRKHEAYVQRGQDIFVIDPKQITVEEGWNPRTVWNPEDHENMKNSIRLYGVLEPLRVRYAEGTILLRSGERRWRAVMDLIAEGEDIAGVPVMMEGLWGEEDTLARAAIFNLHVDFTPLEEAHMVRRFMNFGHPIEAIARKLGRSVATIRNRMALLEASPEDQAALVAGEASVSAVVKTVKQASKRPRKPQDESQESFTIQDATMDQPDASSVPLDRDTARQRLVLHTLVAQRGVVWIIEELLAHVNESEVLDAIEAVTGYDVVCEGMPVRKE